MIENGSIHNTDFILENLTRTLLYEGYALYPYYRSAVKNQKPIPFGVVYPQQYNQYNKYANSFMQTECVVVGNDVRVNINMRFLHLIEIKVFRNETGIDDEKNFEQYYSFNVNERFYQCGWQTIERKINIDGNVEDLYNEEKIIPFEFDESNKEELIYDEEKIVGKKQTSIQSIMGTVVIKAEKLQAAENVYMLSVRINNITDVEDATIITRDDVLRQSFLSTHTILQSTNAKFISHQDVPAEWKEFIKQCNNINTYPILIDENDTALLSSPIILYDHPQINPQSSGDLFDSTEIEEALLLHVNMLTDDEKHRIAQTDEKLKAMLDKVSSLTPKDLMNYHSYIKMEEENSITNQSNRI